MATLGPVQVTLRDDATISIRNAELVDAERVRDFFRAVAAGTEMILTCEDEVPDLDGERKFIGDHFDNPGKLCLLAEADGQIISCAGLAAHPRRRARHTAELGISVSADWRGRGVGRAMMECLLNWALTHPMIEKVCLSVWSINAVAIALYRSLGFIEEGRRIGQVRFAPGRAADEVMMGKFVKRPADVQGAM